ncbi:MAG: FAD-dependent oxidoreductase [Pseudomonadota bacterium]
MSLSSPPRAEPKDARAKIEIIGAGVIGLTAATRALARGAAVRLIAASDGIDANCCSWWAGGMLAPDCEMETAEPLIGALGRESMAYWAEHAAPPAAETGTLVVAPPRDAPELRRFARRTSGGRMLEPEEIAALEPDLEGRFLQALFFETEALMDPRRTLSAMLERLRRGGAEIMLKRRLGPAELSPDPAEEGWADLRFDCRGLAARDALADLRGVRGEMLIVRSREIRLSRPVRLLHPRSPIYILPRDEHLFMIGATMIESEARGGAALRSLLELSAAACALHPAFAEAELVEIGADARPAFPDNLPRVRRRGRTLYLNGAYRHGFLLAPALARRALDWALDGVACHAVCERWEDGAWRGAEGGLEHEDRAHHDHSERGAA